MFGPIVKPKDLREAVQRVAEGGRPLAGGTDLFVRLRKGLEKPQMLVYVGELPELGVLRATREGLEIGAARTHSELLESPLTEPFPILRKTLGTIASPALRAMGTLGGNVVNASPAGDSLVALYLLEAQVRIVGPQGEREVPVQEFIQGPGKTGLGPGELVVSVFLPYVEGEPVSYFRKVGRRQALYISVVSLGALVWLDGEKITKARLALGSVAPRVVRPRAVEEALAGRSAQVEAVQDLVSLLSSLVQPISDLRASADYRRKVSGNLLLDLVLFLQDRK